ncbi:response regulator [Thiomicrospira microaerophila]|uniref:hybrid sensor histidine kinase/response regulator n=1 Tax=Thiomicrospira microaerophila TaxID=406020 RepID=UPI00200CC9AE|nr:hybrid sensor histidine kinase/response regulator [Thiomicrospira microaerophila]UQB42587.1 response regulator [Thiomicrospira microaerophila]
MTMFFSSLLAAVLLALMAKLYTEQHQRQVIAETLTANAVLSQMVDTTLSQRKTALTQFSSLMHDGEQLLPVDQLQAILDQRIVLHHMYNGGLLILDAEAMGLVDSPNLPGRVGTDYSDRPHVVWVSQQREPYISPPFLGRRLQAPIFIVNTPILSDTNQLLGYMIGIMLLEQDELMVQVFEKFKREQERAFLIDLEQRVFVSSTDPQFVFQPIEQWLDESLIQALENQQTSGYVLSMNGEPQFFSAYPLAQTPWVQVSVIDPSSMLAPTRKMLSDMLMLGLLLFLIGLPLFYVLMTRQLKPLCEAAKSLRNAPHQPVPYQSNSKQQDEVGQLIQAFNDSLYLQQTQRKKLEQARHDAELADATKSRFLAVMSHEIRTPLAGILGLADIGIQNPNSTEKMHDCLKKIHLSGENLRELLNDILDLSKIDAGQLQIQSKPFDLKQLLHDIERQYAPLAQQKGLRWSMVLDSQLQPAYCGDRQRLLQVLNNLISNALKFTEQGGVNLFVSCISNAENSAEPHQAWLAFGVEDSGIGISEDQQTLLFQPFQQGHDSVSQFYGGSGLGLFISQDLVRLMGSEGIHVSSQAGQGSCFSFNLPLGVCSDQQLQSLLAEQQVMIDAGQRLLNSTGFHGSVLIVEDMPINRQVLMEWLERVGFDCYLAENGEEAVAMVKQTPFDLVLMDKQMPKMNGFEASLAIREFNRDLPIIGISAHASEFERQAALQAGMNVLLSKPVDSQVLRTMIARLLNQESVDLSQFEMQSDEPVFLIENQAWINQQQGLACVDNQPRLYNQMLLRFKSQWPEESAKLLEQLDGLVNLRQDPRVSSQDYRQAWLSACRQIHRLRGLCATIGAERLEELLICLDKNLAHYHLPDTLFIEQWHQTVKHTLATITT